MEKVGGKYFFLVSNCKGYRCTVRSRTVFVLAVAVGLFSLRLTKLEYFSDT